MPKSVIDYDDVVDGYFEKMKGVIINMIKETPNRGEFLLDLLMISKYFERIGDHAGKYRPVGDLLRNRHSPGN